MTSGSHRMRLARLSLIFLLGGAVYSQAADPPPPIPPPQNSSAPRDTDGRGGFHLKQVRLYGIADVQYGPTSVDRGWVASGGVSWNPELQIGRMFGVSLNLGGHPLKGRFLSDRFLAFEYVAYLFCKVGRWSLEAGGGGQTWTEHGTFLTYGANLAWHPGFTNSFDWLDRVFAGYAVIPVLSTYFTHQFKLGVGIAF